MQILAIDPGPDKSACLVWDGEKVLHADILDNEGIRIGLSAQVRWNAAYDKVAIEMVACYGMPVGKEIFETCLWIGRFMERAVSPVELVYRLQVKTHFCHSARAKDANVRQAIIDRFGGKEKAVGKKASPGPLYGVKSHLWSALAIALFVADQKSLK